MAKRHTFSVTLLPSSGSKEVETSEKANGGRSSKRNFWRTRSLLLYFFPCVWALPSFTCSLFARFLLPSSWYKTLHHRPWNFQLSFPLLNHQWLECNLIRKKCKKSSIKLLEARYSNYFLIYRNDHPAMTSFEGRMSSAFFCIVNYFIFLVWI